MTFVNFWASWQEDFLPRAKRGSVGPKPSWKLQTGRDHWSALTVYELDVEFLPAQDSYDFIGAERAAKIVALNTSATDTHRDVSYSIVSTPSAIVRRLACPPR